MIILDTNIISEAMRVAPNPAVMIWMSAHPGRSFYTTVINEAEILFGLATMQDGRRRTQLETAAQRVFAEDLAGRVLSFDQPAARAYAHLAAERRRMGLPISHADAQIAAIALVNSAQLATRNVNDFSHLDIDIIDPWHVT